MQQNMELAKIAQGGVIVLCGGRSKYSKVRRHYFQHIDNSNFFGRLGYMMYSLAPHGQNNGKICIIGTM